MSNFLQTKEWAEFQESLGRKVFEVGELNIIKHPLPFSKSYLYMPYGPTMPLSLKQMKNIKDIAIRENSIFIKAEPLDDEIARGLVSLGFKWSEKKIQPNKSIVIEITSSEEEILGAVHHKTRYNIRLAERHKIVVQESDDVNIFLSLIKKTAERDSFSPHYEDYYRSLLGYFSGDNEIQVRLWVAWHNERPVASAIVLIYKKTAYYLHGASDYEFRALMGPYILHWQIIRDSKSRGLEKYDLWGIDSKNWPGVTRFKSGWTGDYGRIVEYPGAFDFVFSRFWYLLYMIYKKIR